MPQNYPALWYIVMQVTCLTPQEMQRDSQADDGFSEVEMLGRKLIWLPH